MPIVSLIDILAILLIYFVLTSAPLEEKVFANITLPQAEALAARKSTESRLELAITADSRILLGKEEVAPEALAARLRRLQAERPEAQLQLKADEAAPLGVLVKVWDALTRAGIKVKDVPARILLKKPSAAPSP